MIAADAFLEPAQERGFSFYAGVPCSFLTPLINRVISDPALNYVGAASEGEAVAVAAGAWLAGRRTVVMCQNSGLGNTVNPLTSLNHPFRIPTLLIVTWRGQPGLKDEPQHELMGEVTGSLLDTIAIGHAGFPKEVDAVAAALDRAERAMAADELPFALIMEKGSVRDDGLDQPDQPIHPRGEVADCVRVANGPRGSICCAAFRRLCRRPPLSWRPPARPGASSSPARTARSSSIRWAPWAAHRRWASALLSAQSALCWCWTATARR